MDDGLHRVKTFLLKRWALVFLLGLLTFFSLTGRGFFSFENFQDIMIASTSVLMLAMGMTFVIATGGIDLSVGRTMGLCAIAMAQIIKTLTVMNVSPLISIVFAIICTLLIGICTGLINGFLVAYLKVPSFIATLGMLGIAHGLALIISRGFPIGNLPDVVMNLGNSHLFYILPGQWINFFQMPENVLPSQLRDVTRLIPVVAIVVIAATIFMFIILSKTQFGKHTYAVGNSMVVARRAGINVKTHLLKVYCLASIFAALGGIIYVFRYGSASPLAGEGLMLNSIAAVVIGGASLYGGTGDIQGTILGALIIGTITIGLVILGVQPFYQYAFIGIIIIVGIIIDQLSQQRLSENE